jgi:dTDP-D-glucose 4,6-dehydratase
VRDWLSVEDHCRALERVLAVPPTGDTYNVSGQSTWTNLEVIRLLSTLVDQAFEADSALSRRFPRSPAARGRTASLITHVADRPGHDRRYAMSNAKIERETGFRPAETFERGIQRTLAWYLEHEDWWRRVMDVKLPRMDATPVWIDCVFLTRVGTSRVRPPCIRDSLRLLMWAVRLAAGLVLASFAPACKMWRMTC